MSIQQRKFIVHGMVQGVGFRPFVHRLATRLSLSGYVSNTGQGVEIVLQGPSENIDQFAELLLREHPRLAQPQIIATENLPLNRDLTVFSITASRSDVDRQALVTPDAATCPDCLRELFDPQNRRYRYPFINCTHCGPRYTIIFDIPYDRPNTTMHPFTMCPACQAEYENPSDRRFHAQPNACPICGPKVWLVDPHGRPIATDDPIQQAMAMLEQGCIVALKGLGGFHLAARADHDPAVRELRQRKYRKAKAFALMAKDLETARRFGTIEPAAEDLLTGIERPIVLCPKKENAPISPLVAPRSRFWGIMLPYTPLHALIMRGDYPALVMTSGNESDEPIESHNRQAQDKLSTIADAILLHDRDIYTTCDDSVAKVYTQKPMLLRRARGYAPRPISLQRRGNLDILAVGAELKNTVTFLKGGHAFTSQHIGDLKGTGTYECFLRTIDKLGALIDAHPGIIACDLHPALLSTRFAESYRGARLIRVQHHHAHAAAVMGEHDLDGPVVAIIADGLGYGTDGTIWGCEVLAAWRDRFERRGYLEPVAMPGGDAASREPWRMAVSYLVKTFGYEVGLQKAGRYLSQIEPDTLATIAQMADRQINAPLTSGLGRLFDGVSALLGICPVNTYDAQAAIEMEFVAEGTCPKPYPIEWEIQDTRQFLKIAPLIGGIIADLDQGTSAPIIAGRFHQTIITALCQIAIQIAQELNTDKIVLAGGVFQNDLILGPMIDLLKQRSLSPYFNRQLPVNDGSISFGQAVVADALCK